MSAERPDRIESLVALGQLLRIKQDYEGAAEGLRRRDRAAAGGDAAPLVAVLRARHRPRALQAMGEGRGRLPQGAGAAARAARRAQLSRLFLGRAGPAPGEGAADARARGAAAAQQRPHRRQPRLGALQARPTTRTPCRCSSARSSCCRRTRCCSTISAIPTGASAASPRRGSSGSARCATSRSRSCASSSSASSSASSPPCAAPSR